MEIPLRILILEDRPPDAELMVEELYWAGFEIKWQRVETEADYLAGLDQNPEIILADYVLPQFDGLRALQLLQARAVDIPFIVVTGTISEEAAADCIKRGATDYVLKDRLSRLGPAVKAALEQRKLREQQRQTEAALRASEERFRLLVDGVKDYAIIMLDHEGRVVSWNAGAERIHGYKADEIVGRHFSCFYPKEDIRSGQADRDLRQALAAGQHEIDAWRVRKDASRFWANDVITVLRDESGGLHGFSVITRDITNRKRAEEELRKSEKMFRTLFESSADGIFVEDLNGNVLDANPAACRLHGLDRHELVGKNVINLVPAGKRAEVARDFTKLVSGEWTHAEGCSLTRDGRVVPVDIRVSRIDYAGVPALLLHVRDLAERKLAEEAIQRLASFTEQNRNPILEVNYAGKVTYVNPAGLKLLPDIYGRGLHHPMLAGIEAMTRESMGKEREVVVDEVKVGEVFYERSIYRVPEARLIRIFAVDITEKKQLEKQFLHAQKMEAIGRLAGGVAHDFNNILTAILGYRELIARRLGADHQLQKEADEIRKAAERAATLTRQLLAFSRKQVLEPRVLNLNVVVHDLETMLRRLIGENIALVIKTDSSLGRVKADPSQIEQIIVNLAVNARDAMLPLKRDGVLSVQTMDATVDEDEAGRRADLPAGRYAVLAIRDTGLGMSDEVKAHLFEPFFTTKNKGEGTGLGLATCYGIIKQSGGHITVASELGRGTTFSIYLPVVAAPADVVAKREESGELPRSRGHGESVLVVEDESAVRELCTLILRELGYTVLEAADGQEAIRVLEAQGRKAVSLVLTDVVMPHVGGKELADWVAAHSPQSKLLFISGYADDDTGLDTMIERGAAFLQKPFTGAALARKVRDVLDS